MLEDSRVKFAFALMLGVLSLLGGAQAIAAESVVVRYACEGKQVLAVRRSRPVADVRFDGTAYRLDRKRSSIGERYSSAKAALVIDGPSAVFVAEDNVRLTKCVDSSRVGDAG